MHPKDPLPNIERSAAVYKIDCMDCQCNYVGETAKRIKTRVHEHKLAVRRGDQYSQIWAHMAEWDHRFNFNEISVLASDNTKGGRLLKEAWLSDSNSINRHVDLCPAYVTLRSWSASNQRQHPRRPSNNFNNIKEKEQTPQLIQINPKEESQPWNIPATLARLPQPQRTKEMVKIKIQNPDTTNIRNTVTNAKEDTASERGEEFLNTTIYPHIERNALADSEREERSPRPAEITTLGRERELQGVTNDRPRNATREKEKNGLEWRGRRRRETREDDGAQKTGPSHPPSTNSEDLHETCADTSNARKKMKMGEKRGNNQGECSLAIAAPPGLVTRSMTRTKQCELQSATNDGPVNVFGEKEKNRLERRGRRRGEVHDVNSEDPCGTCIDTSNVGERKKTGEKHWSNQGECDFATTTTPSRSITRSMTHAKQLSTTTARQPPL